MAQINIIDILPELEGDEMLYAQEMIRKMGNEQAKTFAHVYRSRRKDPQTIMLATLFGLILCPGLQRFLLGQIGMGILFFFTGGFLFIGTLIDLVNYKRMTCKRNMEIALEAKAVILRQ